MTYKIYPASEQLMAIPAKQKRSSKYPWHELKLGQAFVISDSEITYPSLITLARRSGARHGRVYRVYHHIADKVFEVGYVADVSKPTQENVAMPSLNVANATNVLDEVRKMEE